MTRAQIPQTRHPAVNPNIRAHVYTRANWDDQWQHAPYLEATSATRTVAPQVDEAEFEYKFGEIRRAGDSDFRQYSPQDLQGKFIQIRLVPATQNPTTQPQRRAAQQAIWTGIVQEESIVPHGTDTPYPQGDQSFRAWGLGHVLDQEAITTAQAIIDGTETEIQSAPEINGTSRWGPDVPGNRSASTGSDGVYLYSDAPDARRWTARQYIDYLLEYHLPAGLTIDIQDIDALDYVVPRYDADGRTPWQVLEHLIPRQRGLIWWLDIVSGTPTIVVDTSFGQDVTVGGVTIDKNSRMTSLNFSDDPKIQQPTVREKHEAQYDKIIARGEPIVSCFTVEMSADTLERAWTDSDETDYEDAANDQRKQDQHSRTYTTYRIPRDFDWEIDGDTVAPAADPSGGVDDDTTVPQFGADRSLLRWIPTPETTSDGESIPSRRKPFAFAKYDPGDGERWIRLDAGHKSSDLTGMGLTMRDGELSFRIDADPNHLLAKNHLDPDSLSGDQEVDEDPVIDYTTIGATIAVRLDQRFKVEGSITQQRTNPRTLTIDVPDAEYWRIHLDSTHEIVDDDDLDRQKQGFNGWATNHGDPDWLTEPLRDDTDKLEKIVALATAWYGTVRRAVSFSTQRLSALDPLGAYVEAAFASSWRLGSVGTPVTQIQWDFESATTSYSTGYHELDIRHLVEFPGLSDERSLAHTIRKQQSQIRRLQERVSDLPTRRVAGKGGGTGGGILLEAQEDMTEDYDDTDDTTRDNTTYEAKPVLSDGTLGSAIDVIRPPGVEIREDQRGVLSISDDGLNVFELSPEYVECRTDDPDSPITGRMWLRTDL